jgi:hypothetical protein
MYVQIKAFHQIGSHHFFKHSSSFSSHHKTPLICILKYTCVISQISKS